MIRKCLSVAFLWASFAGAQVRTRELYKVADGDVYVTVTASSENRVELYASEGADRVLMYVDPGDIKDWAESAEKIATQTATAPASDKLSLRSEDLWGSDEEDLTLRRDVQGGKSTMFLYFADHYVVNTVLVPLTPGRAADFIEALRKAPAAVKELRQ